MKTKNTSSHQILISYVTKLMINIVNVTWRGKKERAVLKCFKPCPLPTIKERNKKEQRETYLIVSELLTQNVSR